MLHPFKTASSCLFIARVRRYTAGAALPYQHFYSVKYYFDFCWVLSLKKIIWRRTNQAPYNQWFFFNFIDRILCFIGRVTKGQLVDDCQYIYIYGPRLCSTLCRPKVISTERRTVHRRYCRAQQKYCINSYIFRIERKSVRIGKEKWRKARAQWSILLAVDLVAFARWLLAIHSTLLR